MNAPKGLVVDHINFDTLNNTKSNLRVVTNRDNILHQPKLILNPFSKGGVSWHKRDKKWMVRVWEHGKRKWLGSFKSKEEAEKTLRTYLEKLAK